MADTNYLILIIEDNPDDRELISRCLNDIAEVGYRCIEAASGEEGLALIKQHKPDCVLLDYSMPGHNGLEILKQIQMMDALLPVIMLTGQGNESIAVQAIKQGAQNYLVKSNVTSELLHRAIGVSIEHACMERKLSDQRKHIEQQAAELELINEELATFTYIASHDLRSPLVSLRGFSGEMYRSIDIIVPLLEKTLPGLSEIEREIIRREIGQHIPKSLSYINNAAEKMDRLTSAILKLSRLGRIESVMEAINTNRLVGQCLAALAHQIEQTRTTVEVGDLPEVLGSPTSIEQVFGNLLDNALKYLEPSRPGRIRIHGIQGSSYATFVIQDNGRGIAKGDLHKVFEIFRRAGDVENIPGEGMGMPYVRAIVKRHGGNIWCESNLGEGTTFHFTIAHQQSDKEAA